MRPAVQPFREPAKTTTRQPRRPGTAARRIGSRRSADDPAGRTPDAQGRRGAAAARRAAPTPTRSRSSTSATPTPRSRSRTGSAAARAAADDVCQEAFVDAWRSAGRYDARLGSARSWLLTIVHHRAIDQIRRSDAAARPDGQRRGGGRARRRGRRHRARGARRRPSAPRPQGLLATLPGRAAPRRLARLLLRLLAQRDRRAAGHAARARSSRACGARSARCATTSRKEPRHERLHATRG